MTTSDLNRETQLPNRVSLGDVLGSIEMTPGEMSTLLANWAGAFMGTAHHNLGLLLRDHAALVADPQTYGYKAPETAPVTDQPAYSAPHAPKYAETYGGANTGAGVAAEQYRPAAAQGQSTTFSTLRTGEADASRNQDPALMPTSSPAVGSPTTATDISGMPLTDDDTRQYSHPQGSAIDRAAAAQQSQRIADLERQLAEARGEKSPADSSFSVRSEATKPEDIA